MKNFKAKFSKWYLDTYESAPSACVIVWRVDNQLIEVPQEVIDKFYEQSEFENDKYIEDTLSSMVDDNLENLAEYCLELLQEVTLGDD